MAARARFHPGPVQRLGHADRVMAGEVERDQRGAPRRVAGAVDGDPRDGGEPVQGAGGQLLVPAGRCGPWRRCTAARSQGPGGPEVDGAARGQRQVEQQAQGLGGDDRAEDVWASRRRTSRAARCTRPARGTRAPRRSCRRRTGTAARPPAGAPWRTARRPRTAPASCGRRTPGSPRPRACTSMNEPGTSWAPSTSR